MIRAFRPRRIPQTREARDMGENLFKRLGVMPPADPLRMNRQREIPTASILGLELAKPVSLQRIDPIKAGAFHWKHQEKLVVAAVMVRKRQDRLALQDVGNPIMGRVVRETVP